MLPAKKRSGEPKQPAGPTAEMESGLLGLLHLPTKSSVSIRLEELDELFEEPASLSDGCPGRLYINGKNRAFCCMHCKLQNCILAARS